MVIVKRIKGRSTAFPAAREYSAGGIVVQDGKVLLVQVRNLEDKVLWTFPKGHLEKGETPRQAALREVEEETGYRCEISLSLGTTRYQFQRKGRPVRKQVRWYLMRPVRQAGLPDAEEILNHEWVSLDRAASRLWYPGDFQLLDLASKSVGFTEWLQ